MNIAVLRQEITKYQELLATQEEEYESALDKASEELDTVRYSLSEQLRQAVEDSTAATNEYAAQRARTARELDALREGAKKATDAADARATAVDAPGVAAEKATAAA